MSLTPPGFAEDIVTLISENLTVQAKSFLNMNAASLNILGKAAAVILTIVYIGLVIGLNLTDSTLETIAVGVSGIASALGIPLGADLWKNAQVKQEESAVAQE